MSGSFFLARLRLYCEAMDYRSFFEGKKVTQMGLGLLGRGVGDAEFLAEMGAELVVTDLKNEEELKQSLERLKPYSNVTYHLGGHRLEDFKNRDFILKAAGVPLDSPFIAEARKNGIPVYVSSALFAKLAPKGVTLIGMTGTRGNSTVTHMVYEVLRGAHEKSGTAVFLGGNVQGLSTLALLSKIKPNDSVVLELDSWQLQGFGDSKISPHVSIFTTFFDDHLNYYKNDRDLYLADKANAFKYQGKDDFLILGEQVESLIRERYSKEIKSKIIVARAVSLPKDLKLQIPGQHNRDNAACAFEAAKALSIPEGEIKSGLENFKSVPGRLELVREVNGIKIYNDTTATTPEATIAGLQALSSPQGSTLIGKKVEPLSRKIILIFGGSDKGLDMSKLAEEIPKYCKAVILLPGSGSLKFKTQNSKIKTEIQNVKSLEEAMDKALSIATKGSTVLFSPAFASFGMFENEYDRGEQFVKIVSVSKR